MSTLNLEILNELIYRDKRIQNTQALHETQLVKVDAKDTLDGLVDVDKVKEIRLSLRRRYAHRGNFIKIFKNWDRTASGRISVQDAHAMINKLALPINFNETRVLFASVTDNEYLSIPDFTNLVYNDDLNMQVDLKKIKCK